MTSTLGVSMNDPWFSLLLIFLALLPFYVADRLCFKKAQSIQGAFQCFRCGTQLAPMQSSEVPVAGGPMASTKARVCPSCAKRDRVIRRLTWLAMAGAFAFTGFLLWQQ